MEDEVVRIIQKSAKKICSLDAITTNMVIK